MGKNRTNASYVPGFWDGVASLFGAAAPVEGQAASDWEALLSDWENVGMDIRKAMDKAAQQ